MQNCFVCNPPSPRVCISVGSFDYYLSRFRLFIISTIYLFMYMAKTTNLRHRLGERIVNERQPRRSSKHTAEKSHLVQGWENLLE